MGKSPLPRLGWNLRDKNWEFRTKHVTGIISLRAYIRTAVLDFPLSAAVWRTGKGWDDVDLPPGLSLEEAKLHIEALLALES